MIKRKRKRSSRRNNLRKVENSLALILVLVRLRVPLAVAVFIGAVSVGVQFELVPVDFLISDNVKLAANFDPPDASLIVTELAPWMRLFCFVGDHI